MVDRHPITRAAGAQRFVMPQREPRVMLWIKRAMIALFSINVMLFSWSMVKRIRQVMRVELSVSSTVLTPGVAVSGDVITTGEVDNPMRLELVQGAHSETLWQRRGKISYVRSYDPRLYRYTPTVVITRELLGRFAPGPATLRLTGVGMQKLLRTPPPRVREIPVTIAR